MMKRICIYCEKWSAGGIESFIASMIQKMNVADFQIDLVCSRVENSPFTETLRAKGIMIHVLSGNRNRILSNRKLFSALMKTRRYDVLHVNAFHGAELYYLSLGKKMGIPRRIAHAHNSMLKKSWLSTFKLAIHNIGKLMYARCGTDLWACSEVAAHFLFPKNLWNGVTVVPNGIDVRRFEFSNEKRRNARAKWGIKDEIVLGNTGRLCQQKNQRFVLEIFNSFLKRHPDSKLLLVGDGEEKALLIRQAEALGIRQKVIFTGFISNVEDLLCAMDVFLFPSVFEGLGIAAVEAQATGLPVICSEQVPIEAMLLPNARRISLKADIEQWVQAVEAACNLSDMREGCATAVKDRGYDMRDVAAMIHDVYGEA